MKMDKAKFMETQMMLLGLCSTLRKFSRAMPLREFVEEIHAAELDGSASNAGQNIKESLIGAKRLAQAILQIDEVYNNMSESILKARPESVTEEQIRKSLGLLKS